MAPAEEIKELVECIRICDYNLEHGRHNPVEQATLRDVHRARMNEILTTEGDKFRSQRSAFHVWALRFLFAWLVVSFCTLVYFIGR